MELAIKGLVFNGSDYSEGKDFIINYTKLPVILELETLASVDKKTVEEQAAKVKFN